MHTARFSMPKRVFGILASIAVFTLLLSLAGPYAALQSRTAAQTSSQATAQLDSAPRALPYRGVATGPSYVPGQVLIKLSDSSIIRSENGALEAASQQLSSALQELHLQIASQVAPGIYKLAANGAASSIDVELAARQLQSVQGVAYAGPNYLLAAANTPNDEQYVKGQQWGIDQIKAPQAWDITTGSSDIVIAILDTGVATNHPDLEDKIVHGYNAITGGGDASDDFGHGTYTAGIAAASSNNGTGIVGVSWGARIMPVKVLNSQGQGSIDNIARGIHWAVDNGARIINASLGGNIASPVLEEAVQYAISHNVLLVASAGNTPDGKPNYPAAYPGVLAVGATARNDTFTGFSSWGPYVRVTAPGVGILSTGWDGGNLTYEYGNGTSASCPFVSGLAALVWSVNPSLTAEQVSWVLEDSADDFGDPGFDEHYGYGRINAFRAVQMAQQGVPTPPPTPVIPTSTTTPGAATTPSATATTPPVLKPALQTDNTEVKPGSNVVLNGSGFGPGELIDLSLLNSQGDFRTIGNAQAGAKGEFRAEVGLPANIASGQAAITAIGVKTNLRASVYLNVTGGGTGGNGGASSVKGRISGAEPSSVNVRLSPATGVNGKDMTASPDGTGVYAFSGLAAGSYVLTASAPGHLPVGPYDVQVNGSADDSRTIDLLLSTNRPAAFDKVPPVANNSTLVFFPEVGHTLKGPFLKYWQQHGGLAIFGYPLSEEFTETSTTDGKQYTVQYFERNRFEYHPENQPPNDVLLGLLGLDVSRGRAFAPGTPIPNDSTHAYFKETQHSLSGPFLKYWQQHGGLAIFGYPISEEFTENGFRVQYFERNRFEYHPEFANSPNEVLLGLLGVEVTSRNGWIQR